MKVSVVIGSVFLYCLTAVGVFAETVYASVGEYEVTSTDISFSLGYVPSDDDGLDKAVEAMVERYAILAVAEGKGYRITEQEVDRAVSLIAKTRGTNNLMSLSAQREYVRQELVISMFIDGIIYPRIEFSDEELFTLFSLNPYDFMKYPPQGKTALKQVFPKYRNAVLDKYVTLMVGSLMAEEIDSVKSELNIRYYR